jgi:hypothetical protein
MAMLKDVQQSKRGRKHILLTILPACHPDKRKRDMGEKALAQTITKVATTLLDVFSEKDLWHRPREWEKHVDFMIHSNQL